MGDELWIGFHEKAAGKRSVTYREALCFDWTAGPALPAATG
jgi:hypothetical protein